MLANRAPRAAHSCKMAASLYFLANYTRDKICILCPIYGLYETMWLYNMFLESRFWSRWPFLGILARTLRFLEFLGSTIVFQVIGKMFWKKSQDVLIDTNVLFPWIKRKIFRLHVHIPCPLQHLLCVRPFRRYLEYTAMKHDHDSRKVKITQELVFSHF